MTANIAVVAIILSLCFGVLLLMRESGYEFDLRNRRNRRMLGGRRVSDRG
jgi:hypothetical protein